ncbi:MAG: metallophosphoesterase family protein [Candidatus Thorarchaeota archaeon]
MRIAAVADVHSPKYLEEFKESLNLIDVPDILLLAGDMVNFGRATQYTNIIQTIDSSIANSVPIIACFGNEEFEDARQEILNLTKGRIVFLDGESEVLEVAKSKIGIVGAPAPKDFRGGNQNLNKIGLREIYESRAGHLSELVREAAAEAEHTILLMHYSPLSERMNDNDTSDYSWWISKTIEDVQPDMVIHGHLHRASRLEIMIGRTRIINAAFPAVGKITEIVL